MYGRPPGELRRRKSAAEGVNGSAIELLLPYRIPYDFALMLDFLRVRSIPGVEHVTETTYARVIAAGSTLLLQVGKRRLARVKLETP